MGPLTAMTGKGATFKWTKVHKEAFHAVKDMVAQDTMLSHPNYKSLFTVHTDASKYQIGGVVSQNGNPLGYFSRKFNAAQANYSVTEKELLGIVESLKHSKTMLLSGVIVVYTDHKNLTYLTNDHGCERVLRQRLIIEEFGAEIKYIKGGNNVVADALSRLPTRNSEDSEELFLNRRVFQDTVAFPLDLNKIKELQQNDVQLKRLLKDKRSKDNYKNIIVNSVKLWTINGKVFVPKEGRPDMLTWYHEGLQHSGPERTSSTLRLHFEWPGVVEDIKRRIKKCSICQKNIK